MASCISECRVLLWTCVDQVTHTPTTDVWMFRTIKHNHQIVGLYAGKSVLQLREEVFAATAMSEKPESRVAEVSGGDKATTPEVPTPALATPLKQKGSGTAAVVLDADHKRDEHECVSCLSFYTLQDYAERGRNVTKVTRLSLMDCGMS